VCLVKKGIPTLRKLPTRPKLEQLFLHYANRQQNKIHRYLPLISPLILEQSFQQNECQSLIQSSILKTIKEWQQLPNYVKSCHENLLVNIQILVELDEANQLMMKFKEAQ
jgi:hypothetical protein